jgi:choline dehydrogenase-like flavoprotein
VCVIGAGAAGLTVATELADSGIDVLVIESGASDNGTLHPLDRVEKAGVPESSVDEGRARGFGGTLQRWGGQCMPIPRDDLQPRSWVPLSGWPMDQEVLARWTAKAYQWLGVPTGTFDRHPWERWHVPPLPFDHDSLVCNFSVFVPELILVSRARARLRKSGNARVLLDATATAIEFSEGFVRRLEVRCEDGGFAEVAARHYVLCCGAIENARLILLSMTVANSIPSGPARLVGRYFHDHVVATAASVDPDGAQELNRWFGQFGRNRVQFYPRLGLPTGLQRDASVLPCTINVVMDFGESSGVGAVLAAAGRLKRGRLPSPSQLAQLGRHVPDAASFLYQRMVRGRPAHNTPSSISIVTMAEQAPLADSRVSLSRTATDCFGLPLARVEWCLDDLDRGTAHVAAETVKQEFRRLRLPEVTVAPWLSEPSGPWREQMRGIYHFGGTTRMARSSDDGVVDSDSRVHGIENLWVSGGSVFPTGTAVNPTLTIVALALRLADQLLHLPPS